MDAGGRGGNGGGNLQSTPGSRWSVCTEEQAGAARDSVSSAVHDSVAALVTGGCEGSEVSAPQGVPVETRSS